VLAKQEVPELVNDLVSASATTVATEFTPVKDESLHPQFSIFSKIHIQNLVNLDRIVNEVKNQLDAT
jgi:hypothetical protein